MGIGTSQIHYGSLRALRVMCHSCLLLCKHGHTPPPKEERREGEGVHRQMILFVRGKDEELLVADAIRPAAADIAALT